MLRKREAIISAKKCIELAHALVNPEVVSHPSGGRESISQSVSFNADHRIKIAEKTNCLSARVNPEEA